MSLIIEGVTKSFLTKHNYVQTLEDINMSISNGEFICIVGPSGCGKSTLLSIIAGIESPDSGRMLLDSKELSGVGPERMLIFQNANLFPWLKVIDNVEFGLKMKGIHKSERNEIAMKYLEMVNLKRFKDSYIHELSGGMKQRVAIARALALNSDILMLDEPFAALDFQTRRILQIELQKIWFETKKTILLVTHNVEEAVYLADRVFIMSSNPGRIISEFTIDIPRPRCFESPEFSKKVTKILADLVGEVEKVVKDEYDTDWHIEKDTFLPDPSDSLGSDLQSKC